MENLNIADGDPVVHEVQVDLHMLRPQMLTGLVERYTALMLSQ